MRNAAISFALLVSTLGLSACTVAHGVEPGEDALGEVDETVDEGDEALGEVDEMLGESQQALVGVAPFTARYSGSFGDTGWCIADLGIHGYAPTSPGKHPVFIYTVGTFGQYDATEADTIVREMARRGFIAASIEYPNGLGWSCDQLRNKASCAYSPWIGASAVSRLCGRVDADCWKGIVVGGMSQGSMMALLAKNYDWRVNGAWLMGATDAFGLFGACVDNGFRLLSGDHVRAINGERDVFANQSTLQVITGNFCAAGEQSCLRPNGSGWYTVRDSQVQDGEADHCYYTTGGCTNEPTLDTGWAPPASTPWSLDTNLDWLAQFANP